MKIDIVTLFPEMCRAPLNESMMKRAQENGALDLRIHNLRDWTTDKHHVVDDAPFGGGQGMVMKPEPIFRAVEDLRDKFEIRSPKSEIGADNTQHPTSNIQHPMGRQLASAEERVSRDAPESKIEHRQSGSDRQSKIVLMSPAGCRLDQELARQLSAESHLIIVCGHYEGIDHRVIEHLVDIELSIGDYVLTNGAIAAVVVVDAVVRLLPGVLGHEQSAADDSFSSGLLEAPQYTRPADFRGWKVPEVLLSGNHAEIAAWRAEQAKNRTRSNRPDLL